MCYVPRQGGYSPAQLLFGRKQFPGLPAISKHYTFYDVESAQAIKDRIAQDSAIY